MLCAEHPARLCMFGSCPHMCLSLSHRSILLPKDCQTLSQCFPSCHSEVSLCFWVLLLSWLRPRVKPPVSKISKVWYTWWCPDCIKTAWLEGGVVLVLLLFAQACNIHCEYFCHVLISSQEVRDSESGTAAVAFSLGLCSASTGPRDMGTWPRQRKHCGSGSVGLGDILC